MRGELRANDPSSPTCGIGRMAGWTGLEPATSDVTGRRSNQLNYHPAKVVGQIQHRWDRATGWWADARRP